MAHNSLPHDYEVLVASINSPTTSIPQHGAPGSSRNQLETQRTSHCGRLLPALLLVLLLMCVALQSVLIFLRVSENARDHPENISHSCVSEQRLTTDPTVTQCDQCVQLYLQGNVTQQGHSLRCPDLWVLNNDKCYFFSEDKQIRSLSDKDCTERGSRLATVKDGTIRRLVTITEKEFWIGLSHYYIYGGVWMGKWTDGNLENVTEGTGSCVKLGSRLTRENCYTELPWICEKDAV